MIVTMQPYHKADDGRYAESYLGAQRCASSYAFRSLLDAGADVEWSAIRPRHVFVEGRLVYEADAVGR